MADWLASRVDALLRRAAGRPELAEMCAQRPPLSVDLRVLAPGAAPSRVRIRLGDPIARAAVDVGRADVVLSGPEAAWSGLLSGEVPYIRQVNIRQGQLTLTGSAVHAAWVTPVLSALFRAEAHA